MVWQARDSDVTRLNLLEESFPPQGRRSIEVTPPVDVTLTAMRDGLETSKTIHIPDVQERLPLVTGQVLGTTGTPVEEPIRVGIDGKLIETDANGVFSATQVGYPYDVILHADDPRYATRYRNLTNDQPVLVDFKSLGSAGPQRLLTGTALATSPEDPDLQTYVHAVGDRRVQYWYDTDPAFSFVLPYSTPSGESTVDLVALRRRRVAPYTVSELKIVPQVLVSEGNVDAGEVQLEPVSTVVRIVNFELPSWAGGVNVISGLRIGTRAPIDLSLPQQSSGASITLTFPQVSNSEHLVEALAIRNAVPSCGCAGSVLVLAPLNQSGGETTVAIPAGIAVEPGGDATIDAPLDLAIDGAGICVVVGSESKTNQRFRVVGTPDQLKVKELPEAQTPGTTWLLEATCYAPFASIDEATQDDSLVRAMAGLVPHQRSTLTPFYLHVR